MPKKIDFLVINYVEKLFPYFVRFLISIIIGFFFCFPVRESVVSLLGNQLSPYMFEYVSLGQLVLLFQFK